MEDFRVTQTGDEIQSILNQSPIDTSDIAGLKEADALLDSRLESVEGKIPAGASAENPLTDKQYVDNAVATASATFRGTYNEVTDLELTTAATHAEISAALADAIDTTDNNDYCFVQIPTSDATPTEISFIERYKFVTSTGWEYEYTLNSSGFTSDQWSAINSGITSTLVTKLTDLPSNSELTILLNGKANAADVYTKTETYNKTELDNMITTPDVNYVTVTATAQTTAVTDLLPAEGAANTIYRIGSWDGTQYNANTYSEYVWDGTAYILLDVKNPGIDSVPTAGSENLVQSGGVYTHPVKMDRFVLPLENYDFRGFIAELYIFKEYFELNGTTAKNLSIKFLTDKIYITNRDNSLSGFIFHCTLSINDISDGVVYKIKSSGTVVEGGAPLGTLIGYVVFKNLSLLDSSYSYGEMVINGIADAAINYSFSPKILDYIQQNTPNFISENALQSNSVSAAKIQDNAVVSSKIQGGAVSPDKISLGAIYSSSVSGYDNDIAEIYAVGTKLTGVARIDVRNYNNSIYFRAFTEETGTTQVWTCSADISQWVNGKVYPLPCTTAGGDASLGDICGYVVFKDISHFRSVSTGAHQNVIDLIRAKILYLQPNIESYVTDVRDGAINTDKIENGAVTADKLASNAVITSKINNSAVTTEKIADGAVGNSKIGFKYYSSTSELAAAYEQGVLDVFIDKTKMGLATGETITYLQFKGYKGILYFKYKTTVVTSATSFELDTATLANISDFEKINVKKGDDIVGYFVLKDKQKFIDNPSGASNDALLDIDVVTSPRDVFHSKGFYPDFSIDVVTATSQQVAEETVNEKIGYNLEILLPSTINAVVGTELNIWNDTISYSLDKGLNSPLNYFVIWNCSVGIVTERGYRFTPVESNAGNSYILTCRLYNTASELVATKQITIVVKAKNALNAAKNIVVFGASQGPSTSINLYNNFHNSEKFTGTIPTMYGTRSTSDIRYECVGGYRWADFATAGRAAFRCFLTNQPEIPLNETYTNNGFTWQVVEVNDGNILITKDSLTYDDHPTASGTLVATKSGVQDIPFDSYENAPANPLWDSSLNGGEGGLSISHYKSVLGITDPSFKFDAVSFQLGLNGTQTLEQNEEYIRNLYNLFISDNPSCLFLLWLMPQGCNTQNGFGDDYGASSSANIKSYRDRAFNYSSMYLSLASELVNMRIVPMNTSIDRYYGYQFSTRLISQRFDGFKNVVRAFECVVSSGLSSVSVGNKYTNNGFVWDVIGKDSSNNKITITKYDTIGTFEPEAGTLSHIGTGTDVVFTNSSLIYSTVVSDTSKYEVFHSNALHPSESGYGQLADSLFAGFIGALTE